MLDVPTQWIGYNTGNNEVRGNYPVFNNLKRYSSNLTVSNGNLTATETTATVSMSSVSMSFGTSGKYYFECNMTSSGSNATFFGVSNAATIFANTITANSGSYRSGGAIYDLSGARPADGNPYTTGDVIAIAVDVTAGTVQFYKNNVAQGNTPSFTFTAGTELWAFLATDNEAGTKTFDLNFGQRPFAYTPPAGFLSLCTTNLPNPTILQGDDYFNATTYTGNGSTQSITNAGATQPDFVWIKGRSDAWGHALFDSVRGVDKRLTTNNTNAEFTTATGVTAFNSNGFAISTNGDVNNLNDTYVGWQWRASNAAAVSNTAGSITSTVSANTTAGFSIVTYTAPASGAFTVGHGLGVAPAMIITKSRSNSGYVWGTYHQSIGNTGRIDLNSTAAVVTSLNGAWNNTSPTSTVFSVGLDWAGSGITYVAYCFAAVPGYSAFGSYTGNGSADGPFVYTGFRPKYVVIKSAIGNTGNWGCFDTSRDTYNIMSGRLELESSGAENTGTPSIDFTSNGFKIRTSNGTFNLSSSVTYIYFAFAENPFKNSLAR
jgi:hypothetical protein